jgi:integrase
MPGWHAGRPPRNKGRRYRADPSTVEEIVAVMRQASDDRHGYRLRRHDGGPWCGGRRVAEALTLGERDLDPGRGSLKRRVSSVSVMCAGGCVILLWKCVLPLGPCERAPGDRAGAACP